jgi:hypothetical protein
MLGWAPVITVPGGATTMTSSSVARMVGCPWKVSEYVPPASLPVHASKTVRPYDTVLAPPPGTRTVLVTTPCPSSSPRVTPVGVPSRTARWIRHRPQYVLAIITSSPAFEPLGWGPITYSGCPRSGASFW